eukprot:m.19057 g.19057  ORF g.19057 m.19057 type:complete len:786 (-) comp5871_c0_seq1:254-2611(-)
MATDEDVGYLDFGRRSTQWSDNGDTTSPVASPVQASPPTTAAAAATAATTTAKDGDEAEMGYLDLPPPAAPGAAAAATTTTTPATTTGDADEVEMGYLDLHSPGAAAAGAAPPSTAPKSAAAAAGADDDNDDGYLVTVSKQTAETSFHFLGEENTLSPPMVRAGSISSRHSARSGRTLPQWNRSHSDTIEPAPTAGGRADLGNMSFEQFAEKFFQDKRRNSAQYLRGMLPGPLLKQVWGDGDSDRVLLSWVTLLRFLGDAPPKKTNPLSNLQLIQLIQNIAITRPHTRDEIYCQICKQLTNNPNKTSSARAWIAMALCAGVFAPSDMLLRVLKPFLAQGPPAYAPFVRDRLLLTMERGTRKQPACALEMHSAFRREPIELTVDFYVGSATVRLHPQTTAADAIASVQRQHVFHNPFGFSMFVGSPQNDLLSSAGSGTVRILDKISQFEQLNEERDWRVLCSTRPYRLMYRKEMFAPWPEGMHNLNLLYKQIVEGMQTGIYRCASTKDLALLLAQQYYISHGHVMDASNLMDLITDRPVAGMEANSFDEWIQLVNDAFVENEYHTKPCTKADIKVDIVAYARENWALEFSKNFKECHVVAKSRQHENVTVAINCKGLFVINSMKTTTRAGGKTSKLATIPFVELLEISDCEPHAENSDWKEITVSGVSGQDLTIAGPTVGSLHATLKGIYRGLCQRSKYAVTLIPQAAGSAVSAKLVTNPGDLIVLPKPIVGEQKGTWSGICERTKKLGEFPAVNVYVVPTVKRPPADVLRKYSEYCQKLGKEAGL